MSQDESFSMGAPLPKISGVEPDSGLAVRVTWATGLSERIDLAPTILVNKLFKPLRSDRTLFDQVHLDEHHSAIVWNGEMGLAAYTLQRLAQSQRAITAETSAPGRRFTGGR